MEYFLMNKNTPVLSFQIEKDKLSDLKVTETGRFHAPLPIGYFNIREFLDGRRAPKHRQHIEKLLKSCGCYQLDGFVDVTHALSLNDTFWVKRADQKLGWNQVSLYQNKFDETIAHIAFEGGLYGEQFSTTSPEFSTDGTYAKCWIQEGKKTYLIKKGSENFRNAGMEPYSEYYSSKVAELLCPHMVEYDLAHYRGAVVTKCELFTTEKIGFIPFHKVVDPQMVKSISAEEIQSIYAKYDSLEDFNRMLVLDSLVLNEDRHLGNHGFLIDNESQDIIRMSPVFDLNVTLLPYAEKEDFQGIDEYIKEKGPRIGADFVKPAQAVMTSAIQAELINMKDFRFEQHPSCPYPEWRLEAINQLLGCQIRAILDMPSYYYETAKTKKEKQPIIPEEGYQLERER